MLPSQTPSAPPKPAQAAAGPLPAPALRLQAVSHRYGHKPWVLKGFELEIPAGAFVTSSRQSAV